MHACVPIHTARSSRAVVIELTLRPFRLDSAAPPARGFSHGITARRATRPRTPGGSTALGAPSALCYFVPVGKRCSSVARLPPGSKGLGTALGVPRVGAGGSVAIWLRICMSWAKGLSSIVSWQCGNVGLLPPSLLATCERSSCVCETSSDDNPLLRELLRVLASEALADDVMDVSIPVKSELLPALIIAPER